MNYEERVREHDGALYQAILPYIYTLPDLRPEETMGRMKQEEQNPWRLVYEELLALGREGREAKEERELMEAITGGKKWRINYYLDNKKLTQRFLTIYSALSYLLLQIDPESVIPVFVATGDISVVDEVTPEVISAIRDKKTAIALREKAGEEEPPQERKKAEEQKEGYLEESESEDSTGELSEGEQEKYFSSLADEVDKRNTGAVYYALVPVYKGRMKLHNVHRLMIIAAERDNPALVEPLLGLPNLGKLMEYRDAEEVVKAAAERGHVEVLSLLFDRFAEIYQGETVKLKYGELVCQTLADVREDLHKVAWKVALKRSQPGVVLFLSTRGMRARPYEVTNAITDGRTTQAKVLLEHKFVEYPPEYKKWYDTAARFNRYEILELLLSYESAKATLSEEELFRYEKLLEKKRY